MTRAQAIREFLRQHATEDKPLWPCEVAAGIPCPDGVDPAKHALSICHSLHVLHQGGFVGKMREGGGRYRYWLISEPVVKPKMDPEERRLRKNEKERMRLRRKRNCARSLDEYKAQRRADAAARKARIAAERVEREAAKQKAREEKALQRAQAATNPAPRPAPAPKPVAAAKPAREPKPAAQQPSVVRMGPSPKPAPVARVETVEEFMARGGKVQRLSAGFVSKPVLRFPPIDFGKQAA